MKGLAIAYTLFIGILILSALFHIKYGSLQPTIDIENSTMVVLVWIAGYKIGKD